jgi:hypothetical protein
MTRGQRIIRALPHWACVLWQYRPVITTHDRLARRIDEVDTAAWLRGNRAARDENERLDQAADRAIADITARINAGPARPRRCPVRITSTGESLRIITGGAA